MSQLPNIRADVAARVAAIRAASPWWPCAKGCADCCRQLARPLELAAEEWRAIDGAVAAMSPSVRGAVLSRARDAVERHTAGARHVVCPFLDDDAGACLVYEARPTMCRAYGYYAARAGGGHCALVEREVAARGDEVLWGNLDALNRALPPRVSLADWLESRGR